ncbi:MAG: hypothetical protein GX465_16025 [Acidobacteria bacterium]|nr:hypothetical protein [Acidobacteriota bacterium]
MPDKPTTEKEWLACLALDEMYEIIPAGHILPIIGPEIWVDGNGRRFSRGDYIKKHGVDPKIGWDAIKAYRKAAGKKDKAVML